MVERERDELEGWGEGVLIWGFQIGLLEPKYLPQGPQTLRQARFETHVPKEENRGEK